jgi:hypothetical protein
MNSKQDNNQTLLIGHEYPEKNEEEIAAKIVKLLEDQMNRMYKKNAKQLRQIHPKMNGFVKAEFIIENDLPQEYRIGLFKEARSYPAWIRFSNGDTKPLPDWKKDIRGFAIKIMDVSGDKIVQSKTDGGNNDFVCMNTKNFVSRDVNHFHKILKVVTTPLTFANFFPKIFTLIKCLPILMRAGKAKIKCDHPFEVSYFSTVPYRLGNETKAVKYAVIPSAKNKLEYTDKSNKDFLRANMVATLLKHEIIYGFFIQEQTDAETMPLEDPTVVWNSPLIKLATIRIPTQIFDTPERNQLGESLSFNSWHCLPEHRPLGNFNRVRRIIYDELYKFRQKHNQVKEKVPHAGPDFFADTNIC